MLLDSKQKKTRLGLRGRFVLIVTLAVTLVVAVSALIEINNRTQELRSEMTQAVEGLGRFVALTAPEALLGYDMLTLNRMIEEISDHNDVVYAVITKGERTLTTHYHGNHPQIEPLLASSSLKPLLRELLPRLRTIERMERLHFPISTEGEILAELEIGVSLLRMDQAATDVITLGLIRGGSLLLILAILIFSVFERHVFIPLQGILAAIQQQKAGHGQYTPAQVIRADELGQVTSSFNQMMIKNEANHTVLHDREQNLSAITDAVQDAIIRIDNRGEVVFWNRAAESTFGIGEQDAIGQNLHQLIVPERYQHEANTALAHFVVTGEGPLIGETREIEALHADGHEFPIEMTLSALPGPEGWHAVGVIRDISERKQAEQEQRLAATAFETEEAIIITDTSGIILRTNKAFTQITGYSAEEAVGKNPRMMQSGRQDASFYRYFWQSLQQHGHWRGEIWNRRKNGEVYPEWLSISAVRDPTGETSHYIGIFSDQSDLIAQRNQITLLLNSTAEGIVGTDQDGLITFANPAMREMLGDEALELIGTDLHTYLHHEGHVEGSSTRECAQFQAAIRGDSIHDLNGTLLSPAGEQLPIEYWIRPIIADSETMGVIMTCVDITARKQAEEMLHDALESLEVRVEERTLQLKTKIVELEQARGELIQSEKMASLGRLVAGFAHEINTPIGIAVGGASHLEESARKVVRMLDQEEVVVEDLLDGLSTMEEASKLTLKSLQRAAKLVQSFKRTAVDQSNSAAHRFNLCTAIDDVVASLHNEFKRTTIAIEIHCDISEPIFSRPGLIEQVLTNLLFNSLKHGFAAGELSGTITVTAALEGPDVVIHYSDSGQGMDEEVRSKIFEPFYTTARGTGGSGLGLFICYNLVTAALKGSINCDSEPGAGSRFDIRFPMILESEPDALA